MTNREILLENYEDAEFALLMEDFAQYRGEEFIKENAQLMDDPEAAVPEAITRQNLNFIQRELAKIRRNGSAKKVGRVFVRFAAAVIMAAALFSAAYAVSREFRAGVLNLLMQFDEKAATFQFVQDESSDGLPELGDPAAVPAVNIGWMPEGYDITNPVNDRLETTINCKNNDGSIISISVYTGEKMLYTFDVENNDYCEDIIIQNQSALLITKDGINRITWADENTNCFVYICSDTADTDTLLKLAENLSVTW